MARELVPKSPDAGDLLSQDEHHERESGAAGGSFRGAIEAFGALYAALTGFAIGGVEAFSDRRAEARAARLRQRVAPARPRRLRDRARRGSLS
jgi:hypothetical protein